MRQVLTLIKMIPCGTANSIAIQSQILGIARGKAIIDLNCERIKLARVLGQSGLRVASVSVYVATLRSCV